MKIIQVDVNYGHGSTGTIVQAIHESLQNQNIDSYVCYGRGRLRREKNVFKYGINFETYLHAFFTRVFGLTGYFSYFSTLRLINIMKKVKPNIVHLHEIHGYHVNIFKLIKYLKETKINVVWTFHSEFMYTGKCGHSYDCNKWQSLCYNCPQLLDYPASLFFDFTKKMYRDKKRMFSNFNNISIVTPSIWLKNRVKMSFINEKRIFVVNNGIDTQKVFYPRKYIDLKNKHKINNEKIILSVGSNIMNQRKGGEWVIKVARKLKLYNYIFIIIGVEKNFHTADENIIFIKKTSDQNELAKYYSMADLTLITSQKETFSVVCVESLACGTPIIGFDSGAPLEIIPKPYGLFFDYGDIESLANGIVSFLNKDIHLSDRDGCRNFCVGKYDKTVMTENYFKIYNECRINNENNII